MASFVQIAALVVLVMWCFQIIAPFITIVLWALIISVAIYPAHVALSKKLGDRQKLSATIFVLGGLAILLVPSINLAGSSVNALHGVGGQMQEGAIAIPAPNESVADWPIVGKQIYSVWNGAASNLEETVNQFRPQLIGLGESVLKFAGSMAIGVLQFVVSLLIVGPFLVIGSSGYKTANTLSTSLIGSSGTALTDLAIETIRSVAKGVLGVAIIQALAAAVVMVIAGIPAAGIWAAIVLVLAIVQLPPWIILAPIAVWYFSVADTTAATIFAVVALFVSISDMFLKPMFLGRGMEIPMLVILLGAIGGAIWAGIIGLFVGAVVLALGYTILCAWMDTDELNNPRQAEATD